MKKLKKFFKIKKRRIITFVLLDIVTIVFASFLTPHAVKKQTEKIPHKIKTASFFIQASQH